MSDGTKPTTKTVLIRSVCRLIPFEAFSFFENKNPIGWHDRFSHTVVTVDVKSKQNI